MKKRVQWYYGPGKSQDILHVFRCEFEPTEQTHGHWIGYAVGPWRTRKLAIEQAGQSKAHPNWMVYLKIKGPFSRRVL